MKHFSEITLIKEVESRDRIGQFTSTKTERTIPCEVGSITRQEWTMAGQRGFSPSCTAIVFSGNYENEKTAILNGERFAVYRSYERSDEQTELYLQKETGV